MKMLALPLLLAACVPMATPGRVLPEGPVRIGQTVRVGGPTVKPLAVIEDSRCPADVVCVWAGQVRLRAEIGTGPGKREMILTLGQPVHVADGMLTLREVTPATHSRKPIKPADYRFSFDFAGSI
jgi:hypothetical protein